MKLSLKKCIKLIFIMYPLQYRDFKNFKILIIDSGSNLLKIHIVSNPLIFVKLLYLIFLLAKIRIILDDLLPKNILINKNYDLLSSKLIKQQNKVLYFQF